ncbi:WAS/WASL-interacting protein family member 1 isoform X2 [Bicyclus anynana]|uniref:WAS/WASL-interacting protein family member 1 isoform X2 n=1 Tax=Bicyclus anynana TaxID=110368 RepID=A0A6J1MVI0_BICAN|nr:WAS/WASL-interacting protein family member 1 isoform X2 [Bicyclus anynana]
MFIVIINNSDMGPSVFVVYSVIILSALATSDNNDQTYQGANPSVATSETQPQTNSTKKAPTETKQADAETTPPIIPQNVWIYVAIGASVLVLLLCQTLCFCLYLRKNPYQPAPSRLNTITAKPGEQNHTSSLYEYECVKDVTNRPEKKPEPPPTSTLPKRQRPPLPLPNDIQGHKSSTLTASATQQMLLQRGKQVSTVPNNPPLPFHPLPPMPSRSPQTRRLPTPVRTPVLKKRESIRNDRSYKIYESLPDLRETRINPKPPPGHLPMMFTPPTPVISQSVNRGRILHDRDTASPTLPSKPRMPLPQELNRYEHRKHSITSSSSWNISSAVSPSAPSSVNRPKISNENQSVSNELMEKLKRRANLNSQIANTATRSPALHKPPILPPPKLIPKPKYMDESSDDDEWTMEEIQPVNLYNV